MSSRSDRGATGAQTIDQGIRMRTKKNKTSVARQETAEPAERRCGVTHFRISGEYLTRAARDIFLSDMPGKAWRLIVDGLGGGPPGAAEHVASELLDGRQKLVGDETGMDAADDDDLEYIAQVRYLYAGRIRIDGTWWRPSAEVMDLGPDDADHANSRRVRTRGITERGYDDRVSFYAGEGDRVCRVDRPDRDPWEACIIFEACGEPPVWWTENTTPTKALADFLAAGRTLTKEGWSARCGDRARSVPDEDSDEELPRPSRSAVAMERALREDAQEVEYRAELDRIRLGVIERANGDMLDVTTEGGKVVASVPRAPFMNWALHRTSLRHLAPAWKCVAHSGTKMTNDDPYHTDWWLGAGLPIEDAYNPDSEVCKGADHTMYELQERLGNFECAVLVGGADVYGVVGTDIIVLPDLHPDRLESLLSAKGVITEAGGALAHLAQVALERNIPIVLVPKACTRYPAGTRVSICPSAGLVHVSLYQEKS